MLPTKFELILQNGFREDFFLIGLSQTRMAYGSHISVHKDVTEGRTDGRKDGQTVGSVTIPLRNFVGEGIIKLEAQ